MKFKLSLFIFTIWAAVGWTSAQVATSGTNVQSGTQAPLYAGQVCFGAAGCATVANGSFGPYNVAPATYTVTVLNNLGTTILTLNSVALSGSAWSFDTYALPQVVSPMVSGFGLGRPYLPCARGAIYNQTNPDQPNLRTWTGDASPLCQWTNSAGPPPTPGVGNPIGSIGAAGNPIAPCGASNTNQLYTNFLTNIVMVCHGNAWTNTTGGTTGAFLLLSGGTMTGPLVLAADPTAPLGAVTKQYSDANTNNKLPLAGGTMTGLVLLSANPTVNLGAATKQYVDANTSNKLPLAGGVMLGPLTLATDPTNALQAATKQYVDNGLVGYLALTGGTVTGPLTVQGVMDSFYLDGQVDISAYGALCNGTHADQAAVSAASVYAGNRYAVTGADTTITISFGATGRCNITGTIVYQSGSHFVGTGGTIVNNAASTTSFSNSSLGDGNDWVTFDGVRIEQTTDGSAPAIYYNGGQATSPANQHRHFWVVNSSIKGSGYGIIAGVYTQTGSDNHHLTDIRLDHNTVWCDPLAGPIHDPQCRDGIHLGGDVSEFTMNSNNVYDRDDAGLALSSSGGTSYSNFPGLLFRLTPADGTISNNNSTDNGTGIDFSGGLNVTAAGNTCLGYMTDSTFGGNPAIRFVYGGSLPLPSHINVVGGTYQYVHAGGEADPGNFVVDESGTALSGSTYPLADITINGVTTNGLVFIRGNTVNMNHSVFEPGTQLTVTNENSPFTVTNNVFIRDTTWVGTRNYTTTPINGGLSASWLINDYSTGDNNFASFPLTTTFNGTSAVSSLPFIECGEIPGTSGVVEPDCMKLQLTYPGFNNPLANINFTHFGSTAGSQYNFDGPITVPSGGTMATTSSAPTATCVVPNGYIPVTVNGVVLHIATCP